MDRIVVASPWWHSTLVIYVLALCNLFIKGEWLNKMVIYLGFYKVKWEVNLCQCW